MDWNAAKDQILGYLTVGFIAYISYELRQIRSWIQTFAVREAVLSERVESHEKRLDSHGHRINKIEGKVFQKA